MLTDFIIERDPGKLYRVIGGPAGGQLYRLTSAGDGWEHVRAVAGHELAAWRPHAKTGSDAANLRRLPVAVGAV